MHVRSATHSFRFVAAGRVTARGVFKNPEHAAAGYIGSASMLEAVKKVVQRLRERNPDLTYGAR